MSRDRQDHPRGQLPRRLNRIRTDGTLVPQQYREYLRSKETCRALERDFGLRPVRNERTRFGERVLKRAEDRMARDRGLVSEIEQLKALIGEAAKDAATMSEFIRRLQAKGAATSQRDGGERRASELCARRGAVSRARAAPASRSACEQRPRFARRSGGSSDLARAVSACRSRGRHDKLTEFQKSQDCIVRELQESVQGLKHQADVLARWHAWRTRRVAAWGVVLGVLVGAVVALSWQTRAVALRTHAVLEQILENQAHIQAAKVQAQAVKGGRRR